MSLRLPDTGADVLPDGRRMVPSAQRNLAAILQVLRDNAPRQGRLLEIASGSGLHAAHFAAELPGLVWQTTDFDPGNFASIRAWADTSTGQILAPQRLDATGARWSADWPEQDALLLVNLLHLIPETGAVTLLTEIALALAPGGLAFLYGPFLRNGHATSPGDAAFDASLRAQNPAIGYKDIDWVTNHLRDSGLVPTVLEMPANNLMILARK